MSTETFKPGDRVVWWKQTPGGDYVFPILSTVLAVTAKRIKIEAEDDEGKVIRHVLPRSIEHHATPPKSGGKPSQGSKPGRSKRPGKEPGAAQSKRSGPSVVRWGRASTPEKDEDRESRIRMEIVVDAYGEEERALSWYYYLQENLGDSFRARCVEEREVSSLSAGDAVEVVGMPPERECEREMFVSIRWGQRKLAVPLAQLEVVEADDETREAVEDCLYWVGRGYQFSTVSEGPHHDRPDLLFGNDRPDATAFAVVFKSITFENLADTIMHARIVPRLPRWGVAESRSMGGKAQPRVLSSPNPIQLHGCVRIVS